MKNLSMEKLKRIGEKIIAYPFTHNLNILGKIFRTDKVSGHKYVMHYEHHLKKFRDKYINLLEIGVGGYNNPKKGGKSLRIWKSYFPKAKIYSIDIFDKKEIQEQRIKIYQGSQIDESLINELVADSGNFDIIIDDGSHINEHVIKSFELLFPHLNLGGIYIIEDTQTSYWPKYGGNNPHESNPHTIMNFFKSLTDSLNHMEFLIDDYKPKYYDKHITSIHFYHNLIIIQKGLNNECSNIRKEDKY
jgi:hypothetical protein